MRVISFGKRHLPLAGESCSFPDPCIFPLSMASFPARRGKRIGVLWPEFLLAYLVTLSYYLRHVSLTFVAPTEDAP